MHMYNEEQSKERAKRIGESLNQQDTEPTIRKVADGLGIETNPNIQPNQYPAIEIVELDKVEDMGVPLLTSFVDYISTMDEAHLQAIRHGLGSLNEGQRQAISRAFRKLFLGGDK